MEKVENSRERPPVSSSQPDEPRAGFTVIDRRPWAERLDAEATEGLEEAAIEEPRYPSFVEELLEKLQEKDRKLKEFLASYKEEAKRENEEFRRRLTKEMERRLETAKVDLIRSFLDVLDNLDRALAHAANQGFPEGTASKKGPESPERGETPSDAGGTPRSGAGPLLRGVESVRDQFLGVLRELGVQRLSRCGQTFTPETDEALQVTPVDEARKDNLVLEEIQPGYALNDKLIRPAMVKVGRFFQG